MVSLFYFVPSVQILALSLCFLKFYPPDFWWCVVILDVATKTMGANEIANLIIFKMIQNELLCKDASKLTARWYHYVL